MTSQSESNVVAAVAHAARTLRDWVVEPIPPDVESLAEQTLRRAAETTGTARALLIWEDPEEPWLYLSQLSEDGSVTTTQEMYSLYTPVVEGELARVPFLIDPEGRVTILGDTAPEVVSTESPVNSQLAEDKRLQQALVIPLQDSPLSGHLFLCQIPSAVELLPLAAVIGSIAVRRSQILSDIERAAQEAVDRRLADTARDLHDGVLQSFTGVVLQLETVHQLIDDDPAEAKKLVTELQSVLMREQRDLRSYLEQIQPKRRKGEEEFDLVERLDELSKRYASEWSIDLTFDRSNVDPVVLKAIGWETYRILAEAINNAARHGSARNVRAELVTDGDRLCIFVRDDGEGFAFRGRLGIEELTAKGQGPRSLMERVSGLNGDLFVESTDNGSTVEVRVPIGWGG